MNISNQLTVLRIILAFVCVGFTLWNTFSSLLIAFLVFIVASVTDFLDGFFARRHNLVTDLGKILDPIADKTLIICVFLAFLELDMVNTWIVSAIILRELILTSVRLFSLNKGVVLEARFLGKQKTVSQIAGIIVIFLVLLLHKRAPANPAVLFLHDKFVPAMMWYILVITVVSGLHYLWQNRKVIKTF